MLKRSVIALVLVVGAMVASVAYFASGAPDGVTEAEPLPVVGDSVGGFDPNDIEMSAAQEAALADGYISDAEYEAAVYATVACFKEHGLEMKVEPTPDASGVNLHYEVWAGAGPGERGGQDAHDIVDACFFEHQRGVVSLRGRQRLPEEETLADARAALAGCLVESGVPEGSIDPAKLAAVRVEHFAACSDAVSEEFGLPNFAG